MLTRRKKQQILFFVFGFFVGVSLSAVVAYFSIIKQFTRTQIEKIKILPSKKDTTVIVHYNYVETPTAKQMQKTNADSLVAITDHISLIDTDNIVVQRDRMITKNRIIVHHQGDSLESLNVLPNEIMVEQWESPMQFVGYKFNQNQLIVYGIDIADIEIITKNGQYFLIIDNNEMMLKNTNTFLHFPDYFLQQETEISE